MFERYTEKARRVVFFARYEASQFGSPYIETEHLLLGLLREDKALTNRFLHSHAAIESIRKQIEQLTTVREKVSTSADLPLSNESKRVLAYAAEEAERLGHKHIGTEHLLLGLLSEEKCFAAEILKERGLSRSKIREELARFPRQEALGAARAPLSAGGEFSRDLSAAARRGALGTVIGRDQEISALAAVLSSPERKHAVLIGDREAGKSAIVNGLALRIAARGTPPELWERRVFALDLEELASGIKYREEVEARLQVFLQEVTDSFDALLFIPDLARLLGGASKEGVPNAATILQPALTSGQIRCILETTPADYLAMVANYAWLAEYSQQVPVPPLAQDTLLKLLHVVKEELGRQHAISYADAAVELAARRSEGRVGKAVNVLEAAGWRVKSRQSLLPREVDKALREFKLMERRVESAVANHEFTSARSYSDEVSKLRAALQELYAKHQIDVSTVGTVQVEDVEYVLARWLE